MADEKKQIYELEIKGLDDQLKKLSELNSLIEQQRAEIKQLKDTDKTLAEERKVQLKQTQDQYRQLSKEVKAERDAVEKGTQTLAQKRAELARLNKELENTAIGTDTFKRLQVESKKLRAEINGADEAVGKFQGNVGNYKNAIVDAFQQMGINIKALTTPIQNINNTYNTFVNDAKNNTNALQLANDGLTKSLSGTSKALRILKIALISIGIGAIVVILGSIVAFLTTTQKGIDAINKLLIPLGNTLQRVLGIAQQLGEVFVNIFRGKASWSELGDVIGTVGDQLSEAWKQGQRLVEIQKELRNITLAIAANEGRINRQIAEQRQILEDLNRTDAERKKAGEQAIALQNALTQLKQQELEKQLEQAKIKAGQNDTDVATLTEIAKLSQDIEQLQADNLNKQREVKNKINAIDKKAADDQLKAAQQLRDTYSTLIPELQAKVNELAIQTRDALKPETGAELRDAYSEIFEQERQFAESRRFQFEQEKDIRLEVLRDQLEEGLLTEKEFAAQSYEVSKSLADQKSELERDVLDAKFAALEAGLNLVGEFAGKDSKIAKAAAILSAIVNTYKAANLALSSYPPPVGQIFAGIAIAQGIANVAKIRQTSEPKFASGVIGLQGAGTETSDSITARLSKGESVMTARATKVFAPILADMERAVGNQPNYNPSGRRFASGLIGSPRTDFTQPTERIIRETIEAVSRIPVVVAEGDITSTQNKVRRINVSGDL